MPREPDESPSNVRAEGPVVPTISETAGGIPDEAIGPAQRGVPEQLDLATDETAEAMAAKLQAEVDERWRTGGAGSQSGRPPRSPS